VDLHDGSGRAKIGDVTALAERKSLKVWLKYSLSSLGTHGFSGVAGFPQVLKTVLLLYFSLLQFS
jgi:hypothetical protein